MKLKKKALILGALLLMLCGLFAGCSEKQTPYQVNDAENYTLSVKYDANGGTFTTNTSVIVDTYDLSQIGEDGSGAKKIALLAPENEARGNNAFEAGKNGYFLAGWYTQRTEAGVDEEGNPLYTYSGKWDFENDRLTVDPGKTYTSAEPEITLYAAWIPVFQIEYYDRLTGELLSTSAYNPAQNGDIQMPQWNVSTGRLDMHDIPKRENYTYCGAYFDAQGNEPVSTDVLQHCAVVNEETATAENTTMKLYIDWQAGEWYHIYNVDQFLDNASLNGSYVIHEDLDFSDKIWPTVMMYGTFTGTIEGNGHTFSNIELVQTNNSKNYAGLFGQLSESAQLSDLTFKNVTFTVKSGTRVAGTAYGLLAGAVADGAQLNAINILESSLLIDSGCYFGTEDYTIGLLCGMGSATVDTADITCGATGNDPEKVIISVTDETVSVSFAE